MKDGIWLPMNHIWKYIEDNEFKKFVRSFGHNLKLNKHKMQHHLQKRKYRRHDATQRAESLLLSTEKQKRTSKNACPFCLAEEEDSFNSGASEFTHISEASTLNALLQATMLRIRATNRTIVGYVRCARFPQMQALASLFACGQPRGRGFSGVAACASHTVLLKSHYCKQ